MDSILVEVMRKVLLVDNNDRLLGYEELAACHTGRGKRHRAFVTLLFNLKGEVILQRRKHRLFDGLWDLTAISHPLRTNGKDETYQEASDRALKKEMGIGHVPIKKVGAFNYFARDGKNCENEYCAVLVGNYNGRFRANKAEVYETKVVKFEKFTKELGKDPSLYTPWAREAVEVLRGRGVFREKLEGFLEEFNRFSEEFFRGKQKLLKIYPKLIAKFYEELEDFGIGGKAMRPFLVYLGYRLSGGKDIKRVLPVCLAVELLHSLLLIHDDIIDESPTRRGKPTVHRKFAKKLDSLKNLKVREHYGISQAIVLGDISCFEAFKLINNSSFPNSLKQKVIDKLCEVLIDTGYGEALDVEYSYFKARLADVMQVCDFKTARYTFVGPLTLGAILAGADGKMQRVLEQFGSVLGVAFQIKDDLLGVFGEEKVLGKSVLSDMREGKNTILIYKTRELIGLEGKMRLGEIWGKQGASNKDLDYVMGIIEKSGAREWCERQNEKFIKKAKMQIPLITKDAKLTAVLLQMADFVVERES